MLTLHSAPLWVHSAFEMLAITLGGVFYRRHALNLEMPADTRFAVFAAAFLGAAFGCKIPVLMEHPYETATMVSTSHGWLELLTGGKSILGAILGAWVSIEGVKKLIGHTRPTGDAFAGALMLGIGVGRLGCLLCALPDHSYGVVTSLPWAINFGDGLGRHPLPAYEILFMLTLAGGLRWLQRLPSYRTGDAFQYFMTAYCLFRFAMEWLKPMVPYYGGLSAIQVLALVGLAMTLPFWWRRLTRHVFLAERSMPSAAIIEGDLPT